MRNIERQTVSLNFRKIPVSVYNILLKKQKELENECEFCSYNIEQTFIKILKKIDEIKL